MSKNKFPALDLIVVNFYPFKMLLNQRIKKYYRKYRHWGSDLVRAAAKIFIM